MCLQPAHIQNTHVFEGKLFGCVFSHLWEHLGDDESVPLPVFHHQLMLAVDWQGKLESCLLLIVKVMLWLYASLSEFFFILLVQYIRCGFWIQNFLSAAQSVPVCVRVYACLFISCWFFRMLMSFCFSQYVHIVFIIQLTRQHTSQFLSRSFTICTAWDTYLFLTLDAGKEKHLTDTKSRENWKKCKQGKNLWKGHRGATIPHW